MSAYQWKDDVLRELSHTHRTVFDGVWMRYYTTSVDGKGMGDYTRSSTRQDDLLASPFLSLLAPVNSAPLILRTFLDLAALMPDC
jgi:hypothetical protein